MERVLFLVGGLGNGGAERVALTLADGLWDKGYLVDVFYFREDKKNIWFKMPGKADQKRRSDQYSDISAKVYKADQP